MIVSTKTVKIVILIYFLVTFLMPVVSRAETITDSNGYVPLTTLPGVFNAGATTSVNNIVGSIYQISIGIGAMLAVIMIVWGGMKYTLSEAITSKEEARTNIRNAILGLLLLLSCYMILKTINNHLVNINLANFGDQAKLATGGVLDVVKEYEPGWYWQCEADITGPIDQTIDSTKFNSYSDCKANIDSMRNPKDGVSKSILFPNGAKCTVSKECYQVTPPQTDPTGTWFFYANTSVGEVESISWLSRFASLYNGDASSFISLDGFFGPYKTSELCEAAKGSLNISDPQAVCREDTNGPGCYLTLDVKQTAYSVTANKFSTITYCSINLASAGNEKDYDYLINPTGSNIYRTACTPSACAINTSGTSVYQAKEWCYVKGGSTLVCNNFTTLQACEDDQKNVGIFTSYSKCAPKIQ